MKFSTTIYSLSILSVALAADCPRAPRCSAFQTLGENFAELNYYLSQSSAACLSLDTFGDCIKAIAPQYTAKFVPAAISIAGEVVAGRETNSEIVSASAKTANLMRSCPIEAPKNIDWLSYPIPTSQCILLFSDLLGTISRSPLLQGLIESLDPFCSSTTAKCAATNTLLTNLEEVYNYSAFLQQNPSCLTRSVSQNGAVMSCMQTLQVQFVTRVAPVMRDEIARLTDPVNPITNPLEYRGVMMFVDLASTCPFPAVITDAAWISDSTALLGCLQKFYDLVEFIKSDPSNINAINTSF